MRDHDTRVLAAGSRPAPEREGQPEGFSFGYLTDGDGPGLDRRRPAARRAKDRPARWLTASMFSLAVLAAASATVSYAAQYRMVFAAKAVVPVAA